MKKIEVVAAIIKKDQNVLCLQRNENKYDYISYKYEFPGGKVEQGEDLKTALQRELLEEMTLDLQEEQMTYLMTVEHTYTDFHITLHAFICRVEEINYVLTEHISSQWSNASNIKTLDWAAADVPIVDKLLKEGII